MSWINMALVLGYNKALHNKAWVILAQVMGVGLLAPLRVCPRDLPIKAVRMPR